jgi:hypothetical protein
MMIVMKRRCGTQRRFGHSWIAGSMLAPLLYFWSHRDGRDGALASIATDALFQLYRLRILRTTYFTNRKPLGWSFAIAYAACSTVRFRTFHVVAGQSAVLIAVLAEMGRTSAAPWQRNA